MSGGPNPDRPPEVLGFEHATIGYEGRAAVRDVTLRIDAGEGVAVLGANGAGKSTLIRAVVGLAQLLAGRIRVFGADRDRFGDWWRVGYVPQAHTVASGIPTTVREVVAAGRVRGRAPWRRLDATDRTAIAGAIDAVGLTPKARAPVATLSGGQQRRALIARALAGGPEVLVLDEPTAGVDTANQQALAAILEALAEQGMTIVLVTHELGPFAPLITRALVMRDGSIAFAGPPAGAPTAEGGDPHHVHGAPPERRPGPGLVTAGWYRPGS